MVALFREFLQFCPQSIPSLDVRISINHREYPRFMSPKAKFHGDELVVRVDDRHFDLFRFPEDLNPPLETLGFHSKAAPVANLVTYGLGSVPRYMRFYQRDNIRLLHTKMLFEDA